MIEDSETTVFEKIPKDHLASLRSEDFTSGSRQAIDPFAKLRTENLFIKNKPLRDHLAALATQSNT